MRFKLSWRLAVWLALTITLFVVAGRAFIIAARTNGGGEILKTHLLAGVPPMFRTAGPPADARRYEQESWLNRQCSYILKAPQTTAETFMGAALLVVHDRWLFPQCNTDVLALGNIVWATSPRRDFVQHAAIEPDAIYNLANQLAQRATDLEPANPDWWRLRAIICGKGEPKHWFKHREEIFAKAAQLDADNSLYDYLNSDACWMSSIKLAQWHRDGSQQARIAELISEAEASLQAARDKRTLAFGVTRASAMHSFLVQSNGELEGKLIPGAARAASRVRSEAVLQCIRPILGLLAKHEQAQDLNGQWKQYAALLKFSEQWSATHETTANYPLWLPLQRRALDGMATLLPVISPDIQPDDAVNIDNRLRDVRLNAAALDRILGQFTRDLERVELRPKSDVVSSVVAVASGGLTWLWLLLVAVCGGVSQLLAWRGTREPRHTNIFIAALVPVTAGALTFLLLGITPVLELKMPILAIVVQGLRLVICVAVVGGALWWSIRFLRRGKQVSPAERGVWYQVVRMGLIIVTPPVIVLVLVLAFDTRNREILPNIAAWFLAFEPAKDAGIGSFLPWALSERLNIKDNPPAWIIVQWGVHGGIYWTAAAALFLVLLWHAVVAWRARKCDVSTSWQDRARWHGVHFFHRAALAAAWGAVLCAIVFFWAAGTWIDSLHRRYEIQMQRLANPMWYDELIAARLNANKTP